MRKQTKLVAVLSTAALLAIGASMTSFAATGWAEEDGTWVYYNKDGDRATETWKKSGDNWYYLDDAGEMAVDQLIEDNDNYYYVDVNGTMVTNQWVSIENEDYDGSEDEPSEWWYYFQSNGKALKGSDNNSVSLKTVNGKKYTFDDEGKMMYGWVDANGERQTGDDAWQTGVYYFGDENDGSMSIGWVMLNITDDNANSQQNGNRLDTAFEDEDQDRYFYFKTNGKRYEAASGQILNKTIDGKKYGFDEYGRMVAEWSENATPKNVATLSVASTTTATGVSNTSWRYYGSPEDGARITKGWFKVVPALGLNAGKYNDDEDKWYYSDNDGQLVTNTIKTIKGKKYAFDETGIMLTGLRFLSVNANNKNQIVQAHDTDWYDTEDEFDDFSNGVASYKAGELTPSYANPNTEYVTYAYYFDEGSGSVEGAMKTGRQTIDIDGDNLTFMLDKSGGTKGAGKMGEEDDKYYLNGKLMKADKEDKYSVLKVTKNSANQITAMEVMTTDEFTTTATLTEVTSSTGQNVSEYGTGATVHLKKGDSYYAGIPTNGSGVTYYLVNSSGKVETKNKEKAKDGNDRYYAVKGGKIIAVYEED